MTISPGRYVAVTANAAPTDPQAAADLAAATAAGAIAGDIAGRASGREAGLEAGTEVASQAGATAGAEAGEIAGAQAGNQAGATAGASAGAAAGTAAAGVVVASKANTNADNVAAQAPAWRTAIGAASSAALAAGAGATLVGLDGPGTGAVTVDLAETILSVIRTPLMYGAIGDGSSHALSTRFGTLGAAQLLYPFVTSLTQQIDWAAIQACANSGASLVRMGDGYDYRVQDTVVFPDNQNVDFDTSKVTFIGTRDRVCVQFGSNTGAANNGRFRNVWVESSVTDVTSDTFIGVRFVNCQRTSFDVHRVTGFTRDVELYSKGQGFTGVKGHISFLGDCKRALTLTCDSTGGAFNYMNGVDVFIEDWTIVTAPTTGDVSGLDMRGVGAGTLSGMNGNRIKFGTAQPANGTGGDLRQLASLADIAAQNIIEVDRYETGRGAIMTVVGPAGNGVTASPLVYGNILHVGLIGDASNVLMKIDQQGSARFNVLNYSTDIRYANTEIVFTDLQKKIKAASSSAVVIMGGLHISDNTGIPITEIAPGGVEMLADGVAWNSSARLLGFFCEVEGGETLTIFAKTKGTKGSLGVAVFDANGARLSYTSGIPDVMGGWDQAVFNRWTTDFGGTYVLPNTDEFTFTLSDQVKKVQIFICGPGKFQSFGLRTVQPSVRALTSDSGYYRNDDTYYCVSDPSSGIFGIYGRGDLAMSTSAQSSAAFRSGPQGWQCTLGGMLAPIWVATTAYVAGQVRVNGANVYEVTTGGTSAGSGGPTGTGTGIADGTVTWRYLTTKAIFTALPANLTGSATYDPPNLLTMGTATTTVTVTGAALGDFVEVSFSLDAQGLVLTGYVSAANTITAVLFNPTAGAIDLASGTLRARVEPK